MIYNTEPKYNSLFAIRDWHRYYSLYYNLISLSNKAIHSATKLTSKIRQIYSFSGKKASEKQSCYSDRTQSIYDMVQGAYDRRWQEMKLKQKYQLRRCLIFKVLDITF